METTINRAERFDLPDALIPEQRSAMAEQPGKKYRWGVDPERVLSRPRPQKDEPREHGFGFLGGWLSFVGELTRS